MDRSDSSVQTMHSGGTQHMTLLDCSQGHINDTGLAIPKLSLDCIVEQLCTDLI